jgi:chemotaxis protein histidine kinase CheA
MDPHEQLSDSGSESEQESLDTVLSELKQQMNTIERISMDLTTHVTDLFQRTKRETTDWMNEPLRPVHRIEGWCHVQGLSTTPTLDEFIKACFRVAKSMDLETRIATFKKEDAEILWKGKRRISVFEILSSIPTLFH